jgi:hypothetical protein
MSTARKISIGFLVIGLGLMTLWDVYPALTPELGDTISEVVRDGSWSFYVLPYACGILMGHFFVNKKDRSSRNIPALWVSAGMIAARDALQIASFPGGNSLALLLGIAAGAIWWPQAPAKEKADASNLQE